MWALRPPIGWTAFATCTLCTCVYFTEDKPDCRVCRRPPSHKPRHRAVAEEAGSVTIHSVELRSRESGGVSRAACPPHPQHEYQPVTTQLHTNTDAQVIEQDEQTGMLCCWTLGALLLTLQLQPAHTWRLPWSAPALSDKPLARQLQRAEVRSCAYLDRETPCYDVCIRGIWVHALPSQMAYA